MNSKNVIDMHEAPTTLQIVDRLRNQMGEQKLTQSAVADQLGVSKTVVSQYMSGNYPLLVSEAALAKLEEKILQWLDHAATKKRVQAELPTAPAFVETPTAKRILAALSYAQMGPDLAVIYGGAGVSKTTTICEYRAQNYNVFLIEATPNNASVGGIMRSLAGILDIRGGHRNDLLERFIIDRLRNSEALIVIDEAQFLSDRAIETVRRIAELAGVGLALLGNESIYTQMTGGRRSADFAQIFSRIGRRIRLTRPTKADIDAILDAWRIEGAEERELLQQIALKPGALRMLTKTLKFATLLAQGIPTHRHILAAWRDLSGEV